jgi:hypothetical protein
MGKHMPCVNYKKHQRWHTFFPGKAALRFSGTVYFVYFFGASLVWPNARLAETHLTETHLAEKWPKILQKWIEQTLNINLSPKNTKITF